MRILQTENRISQSMAKKPLAEKLSFIPATALEKQSILKDIFRALLESTQAHAWLGKVASGLQFFGCERHICFRILHLPSRAVRRPANWLDICIQFHQFFLSAKIKFQFNHQRSKTDSWLLQMIISLCQYIN